MTEVTIRRARAEDLGAVVDLLADDMLGTKREDARRPLDPAYTRAFAEIDADPRQYLAVAERDGRIVGTLQLTFIAHINHRGGERAQIEGVRVAASERGRGLGGILIEWAVDAARRRGCRMVQLTTDKQRDDARRFYETLGFRASHEGMKLSL